MVLNELNIQEEGLSLKKVSQHELRELAMFQLMEMKLR